MAKDSSQKTYDRVGVMAGNLNGGQTKVKDANVIFGTLSFAFTEFGDFSVKFKYS